MKTYLEYIKESVQAGKLLDDIIKEINQDGVTIVLLDSGFEALPDFKFIKNNYEISRIDLFTDKIIISNQIYNDEIKNPIDNYPEKIKKLINIIVKILIKQKEFDIDLKMIIDPECDVTFINYFNLEIMKKFHNSYEYQKEIIEMGELYKLKDVKIDDKILQEYPEMKNIKKQIDWT